MAIHLLHLGEGQLQPLGERLAGGIQQLGAESAGELPDHRHDAAEGIPRGRCGLGWTPAGTASVTWPR
jgi:hypothetical protein